MCGLSLNVGWFIFLIDIISTNHDIIWSTNTTIHYNDSQWIIHGELNMYNNDSYEICSPSSIQRQSSTLDHTNIQLLFSLATETFNSSTNIDSECSIYINTIPIFTVTDSGQAINSIISLPESTWNTSNLSIMIKPEPQTDSCCILSNTVTVTGTKILSNSTYSYNYSSSEDSQSPSAPTTKPTEPGLIAYEDSTISPNSTTVTNANDSSFVHKDPPKESKESKDSMANTWHDMENNHNLIIILVITFIAGCLCFGILILLPLGLYLRKRIQKAMEISHKLQNQHSSSNMMKSYDNHNLNANEDKFRIEGLNKIQIHPLTNVPSATLSGTTELTSTLTPNTGTRTGTKSSPIGMELQASPLNLQVQQSHSLRKPTNSSHNTSNFYSGRSHNSSFANSIPSNVDLYGDDSIGVPLHNTHSNPAPIRVSLQNQHSNPVIPLPSIHPHPHPSQITLQYQHFPLTVYSLF